MELVRIHVTVNKMARRYETQVNLDALMEGLSIEDPGSILQQAVSDIMGTAGLPVDMAFDGLVKGRACHLYLYWYSKVDLVGVQGAG